MSGRRLGEGLAFLWLICLSITILSACLIAEAKMSHDPEAEESASSKEAGKVYIVYMEKTDDAPEVLESKHTETLASVLGSQDAAKAAILYSYKYGVNGFSAKLTSDQVSALSEKSGVIQVVPSKVYKLHEKTSMTDGSLHL
ncbi:hypothetical protein O6H91_08G116500 [Diphasiastrum complanatum]|uniref:Uncharacterized protein n=1 Tax=Diphasiastrum complanatum TaxID=34168 RepID=A0ACC2D1J4_DIPCM|nr:hypothetical protein O6H91_08G116500 [Diphasiastrum complanatum]